MAQIFNQAFEQKLIYVYRINDTAHEGILKIGEASCNAGMAYFAFEPNCKELNAAAKAPPIFPVRIKITFQE